MEYVLIGFSAAAIVLLLIVIFQRRSEKRDEESAGDEINSLTEQFSRMKGERDRMEVQLQVLQNQFDRARDDGKRLELREQELRHREAERMKELDRQLTDLEHARRVLEEERERVISEEKALQKEKEENRDRIWAVHEQESIRKMSAVCSRSDYGFRWFANTDLPEGFTGSLKPDFLVEFLGQYIIFDAKLSRSGNLQGYLQDQVKKTVKKIVNSPNRDSLYTTLFLVVPDQDIGSLKTFSFYEEGYQVFIIPISGFEPVLAAYRRIREYDLAEAYDPQDREQIVHIIAAFDTHVRQQNAMNILNTLKGIRISASKENLPHDLLESVTERCQSMRLDRFSPTELKRIMDNPEIQLKEIASIIKPSIPKVDTSLIENWGE